jgi:hypothetical protein
VIDDYWKAMTREDFDKIYPFVRAWLGKTLTDHAAAARPVASCGFSRLPHYFSDKILASTNVILVDKLPIPPVASEWGLTQFFEFERGDFNGVTYLNVLFLKRDQSRNEAIHFHELVHVMQWQILGPERFLYLYANGLERFGYRASPLEIMAYGAEAAFVSSTTGFDAERLVAEMLTSASMG